MTVEPHDALVMVQDILGLSMKVDLGCGTKACGGSRKPTFGSKHVIERKLLIGKPKPLDVDGQDS